MEEHIVAVPIGFDESINQVLIVQGIAIPWTAPKFYRAGIRGKPKAYQSGKYQAWKDHVRRTICHKYNPRLAAKGIPIQIEYKFFLLKPQSIKKPTTPHTKKPDLDNLVKGLTDALKGVLFYDDNQITSTKASKQYAESDPPFVVIKMNKWY